MSAQHGDGKQDTPDRADQGALEKQIIKALRKIRDPEIPVNIYDLGLIYDLTLSPEGTAHVRMTLTAPGCPVAGMIVQQVERAVRSVEGIASVNVELVWDPPWTVERMSEAARLELNLEEGQPLPKPGGPKVVQVNPLRR
jgi:FeS assembly SUF system protein